MTGLLQSVLCRLGHHGQHLRGARLPTRGSSCYCLCCGASWVGVYDGADDLWARVA